jgi:Cu/Ag efflux pump CusA
MMRWIVGSSLKFRRLLVALAMGVTIAGIVQVRDTPVDALPEYGLPTVEIQTEALGLSAEEVEQLITVPLEQDLLVGVAFVDEIESVSLPGLSSVVMTFEPGTDLLEARQVVQERLTQAVGVAGLPAVAKLPQMIQPLSSQSRVSMIKLSSQELTPIEVSVLSRWVIAPRLMGVPGVANVSIWGNRERQLQVQVDPERLRQNGVTLAQVVSTAGNALEVSPLSFLEASSPGTGGFIDTPNQRLNVFHEQTITTAEELAQVPLEAPAGGTVTSGAPPIALGAISQVVEDHQPLIGDAVCAGDDDCLLLVVEKFPGANTVEVTKGVESALEALRPGLADMQLDSSVYRPASFVESSVETLGWALLLGGILLVLVIALGFRDWRRSLISITAIVVSAASAALVLYLRGTSVNLLVLAGLVLGLTAVIHDSVTDVHDLSRRLRAHRPEVPHQATTGLDHPATIAEQIRHREESSHARAWRTIVAVSAQTRRAVLYAVLIVAAAMLPLFVIGGEGGAFLPPIALSYLLAVVVSMVVAFTVTPALAMMLLPKAQHRWSEPPLSGRLDRGYGRVASSRLARTRVAVAVCVGLAVIGGLAVPFLDVSLRPSLKEQDLLVHVEAAPGTSLLRMAEITKQAVQDLGSLPGVADVSGHIGRAVMSDETVDVNSGELWVGLARGADRDAARASIEDALDGYEGVSTDVLTYSEERLTDVLQQSDDDVVVRLYGEDPTVLSEKADEVQALVGGVDGVEAADVERAPLQNTMVVEVDLARAQAFGVKPGDVRRAAATLLGGITVGNLFQEQKVFDVVVWGAPQVRESQADLEQLLIDTPRGGHVRLGDVAQVRVEPNPTVIRHESVSTYLDVTADVAGRDVAAVTNEIEGLLEQVEFPLEHHAEMVGGDADGQADRQQFTALALAAAIVILLLLQAAFRSWRLALLAFVCLPLALVGGVAAAVLAGGTITLGSVAGLIAVLGIAARGLVVLIHSFQRLAGSEGVPFGRELVVRASREGLPPTLIAVAGTAAVLAPLAVIGAEPGLEIVHPMVIVVLGGLVTTALVNLFILPVLYLRFGSVPEPDIWADDEVLEPAPELDPVRG